MSEIETTFLEPEENRKDSLFKQKKKKLSATIIIFFANFIINKIKLDLKKEEVVLLQPHETKVKNHNNRDQIFSSLAQLSKEIGYQTNYSPLKFFTSLLDTVQAQIIQKLHKSEFRNDLNISFWQEQAKKIISQNPETAKEKILTMIREDLNHFTKEYLLNNTKAEFELEIPNQGITTSSYQQTTLKESVKKFAAIKKKKKEISRAEIESLVYGDFLNNWFQTAPIGQKLMIISPPGRKAEGYPGLNSYSFVFVYEILPFQKKENKKAKVKMYRQWLNPKQSLSLLKKFSDPKKNPDIKKKKFLEQKTIMLYPIIIDSVIANEEIEIKMSEIYKLNTPKKDKDIKFSEENKKFFWQEFEKIVDKFFYPKIESIINKKNLEKKDWQIIAAALNFSQRAIVDLREKYRIDFKIGKNLKPIIKNINKEENSLEKSWQIFYKTKFDNKKISNQEKKNYIGLLEAAFSNSGGFVGASQKVFSVGSCTLGSIPSLMVKGSQKFGQLNINKAILNPSMLTAKLQKELNGKYICKLCGEIMIKPGICPICGKLDSSQFVKFKAGDNLFKADNNFNMNTNRKNINPKLSNNIGSKKSETVGSSLSNILGGNSESISFSSLLYSN